MQIFKNIRDKIKNERGMLVVEATFVYPITFFVLFFLLFMGNIFFQKANIDNVVQIAAIEGAAEYADPMLLAIEANNNEVPDTKDIDQYIQPYRYLVPGGRDDETEQNIREAMSGYGFFPGMEPQEVSVEAKRNNYVLYQTYEVTAEYKIVLPIKVPFSDEELSLRLSSHAEIAATDPTELIRNTDMVVDYAMRVPQLDQLNGELESMMAGAREFVEKFGQKEAAAEGVPGKDSGIIVVNGETTSSDEGNTEDEVVPTDGGESTTRASEESGEGKTEPSTEPETSNGFVWLVPGGQLELESTTAETQSTMAETQSTTTEPQSTTEIGTTVASETTSAKNVEKPQETTSGNESGSGSNKIQFPENPDDFNPEGLRKIGPFETKNGKIIKWLDENNKAVYEWDEDLTYGSHYHVIGEDGNTRLPNSAGETHFLPGDIFER